MASISANTTSVGKSAWKNVRHAAVVAFKCLCCVPRLLPRFQPSALYGKDMNFAYIGVYVYRHEPIPSLSGVALRATFSPFSVYCKLQIGPTCHTSHEGQGSVLSAKVTRHRAPRRRLPHPPPTRMSTSHVTIDRPMCQKFTRCFIVTLGSDVGPFYNLRQFLCVFYFSLLGRFGELDSYVTAHI